MKLSLLWYPNNVDGLIPLTLIPNEAAVLFQICFALHEGNTSFGFESITYQVYQMPTEEDLHFYIRTKNERRPTYDHFVVSTRYRVHVETDPKISGKDISMSMIEKLIADFAAVPKIDRFIALMKDGSMSFGSVGSWGIGMALFMPLFSAYKGEVDATATDSIVYERGHLPMWSKLTQADRDSQLLLLLPKLADDAPVGHILNDFKTNIQSIILIMDKISDETDYIKLGNKIKGQYALFYNQMDPNFDIASAGDIPPFIQNGKLIDPAIAEIDPYHRTGTVGMSKVIDFQIGKAYLGMLLSIMAGVCKDSIPTMKLKDIDAVSLAITDAGWNPMPDTYSNEIDLIVSAFDQVVNIVAKLKQRKDAAILAYKTKRTAIKAATGKSTTTSTAAFDRLSSAATITDALIIAVMDLIAGPLQKELDVAIAANGGTIASIQWRFGNAKSTVDALVVAINTYGLRIVDTKQLADAQTLVNAIDAASLNTITAAENAVSAVENTLIPLLETTRTDARAHWNSRNAAEEKEREVKLATYLADGKKHKEKALKDKTTSEDSIDPNTIRTFFNYIEKRNRNVQDLITQAKALKSQLTLGADAAIAELEGFSTDIVKIAADVWQRAMTIDRNERLGESKAQYDAIDASDANIESLIAKISIFDFNDEPSLLEEISILDDMIEAFAESVEESLFEKQLQALPAQQYVNVTENNAITWRAFVKNDSDGLISVIQDKGYRTVQTSAKLSVQFVDEVIAATDDLSRLRTQMAIYAFQGVTDTNDPKRRKAFAFSQVSV